MVSTVTGAAMASSKKAAAAKAAKAAKAKKSSQQVQQVGGLKVGELVDSAIIALKESGGSTLPGIKKYISATYNVDAEKLTPAIKKYLKTIADASRAPTFKLSPAKPSGSPASKRVSASKKKPKSSAGAAKKSSPKKKSPAKKKSPKKLATKKPKAKRPAKKSSPKKAKK